MVQYSTELEQLGIIYSKSILPVHIITNNQQMANKLLHVLGKTSKFIAAGCSQNAAAFKRNA